MREPDDPKTGLIAELRSQGIYDANVLEAMRVVPREIFIKEALRGHAYANVALPIACSQTISQPYIVAYMSQELELRSDMTVLEIGTGSGYQTAILSRLAAQVFTIERHVPLLVEAEARFKELGLGNVTTRAGDGSKGWPEAAPFDRIIATAAAESVPPAFIEQLKPNGVLVMPVGPTHGDQTLLRIRKQDRSVETEELVPVRFVPLVEGSA
jgi:protein-L-isoaspartate(D-aspartate) O-methyltransferase